MWVLGPPPSLELRYGEGYTQIFAWKVYQLAL
jgi:hypothetical protein